MSRSRSVIRASSPASSWASLFHQERIFCMSPVMRGSVNHVVQRQRELLTAQLIVATGGLDKTDIGYVTFAFSANGDKLYAINESPKRINQLGGYGSTVLDGIYVSNTGSPVGPWNRIASADKLGSAASGSALYANFGLGYSPGVQAWYNQFLAVDPNDSNHVYAGLEEVYETKNGGSNWSTVGPYWNFYFSCWTPTVVYPPNGTPNAAECPQTTHSDQHSVAIGGSGASQ